jgi:hypothetical protein
MLNISGKQRMLSQKMSKEVTLIALKVDKETNVANSSHKCNAHLRSLT